MMDNSRELRMTGGEFNPTHAPKEEVISLVKKAKKYGTKRLLKIAKKKGNKNNVQI
jgi:hypothetical protein